LAGAAVVGVGAGSVMTNTVPHWLHFAFLPAKAGL
jgi:hypothetical protein